MKQNVLLFVVIEVPSSATCLPPFLVHLFSLLLQWTISPAWMDERATLSNLRHKENPDAAYCLVNGLNLFVVIIGMSQN